MRIAQVSPLYEAVPPRLYGGTERVVSFLTEELVRRGHEVTLFASGDSKTSARLVPCVPKALRLDPESKDWLSAHILQLEQVVGRAGEFDFIHFHVDTLAFPFARRVSTPHLSTLHGRLDLPELSPLYREFQDHPVVSISDDQRTPLPFARWVGTVHHGLPRDLLSFRPGPGSYLAFLGRISPEKRPDRAIEIARRTGIPLKIAAKVDKADQEYFEGVVKPLMEGPLVEFVGEVDEKGKQDFLGNALALLFPIDWPEPFGLVMIEAMACGTPVVAFRRGSVPEVMEDGVTGFVVDTVGQAVKAVEWTLSLDRKACRRVFEERFSVERMAGDYLRLYAKVARSSVRLPAA